MTHCRKHTPAINVMPQQVERNELPQVIWKPRGTTDCLLVNT